jgi:hypothetical protein
VYISNQNKISQLSPTCMFTNHTMWNNSMCFEVENPNMACRENIPIIGNILWFKALVHGF